jgi:hypothetical protein
MHNSELVTRLRAALEEANRHLDPFYDAVKQFSDAISSTNKNFYVVSEYYWNGWHRVVLKSRDISLEVHTVLFQVEALTCQIKYNDEVVKTSNPQNLASDMADVFFELHDVQQYIAWMRVWSDSDKK